jgi:hypothetical protein
VDELYIFLLRQGFDEFKRFAGEASQVAFFAHQFKFTRIHSRQFKELIDQDAHSFCGAFTGLQRLLVFLRGALAGKRKLDLRDIIISTTAFRSSSIFRLPRSTG